MRSQTPDLVWPESYAKAAKLVERRRAALREATEQLDTARKTAQIQCCRCKALFPIATQVYIQTFWYTRPYGCTGGDYWNEGEANWQCPGCGFKNRFDAVKDKGWLDFYRPDLVALKGMFARVRECTCEHSGLYPQPCDDCRKEAEKGRKRK